jgi:large subunit ribosomal protein L10
VVIKKRKVAVGEGERVSPALAEMLARLEIHPVMEGLDLCAVYDHEAQVLFTPDVLHIDLSKYFSDIKEGAKAALSLATHIKFDYPTPYTIRDLLIAYPTSVTIKPLIQKAYSDARNLSINACIYERDTMAYLLAKACSQAQSLARYVER